MTNWNLPIKSWSDVVVVVDVDVAVDVDVDVVVDVSVVEVIFMFDKI